MRFFFLKSFSQNFFIQVFLFLLINNNFLWSFKNRSCFTQKKKKKKKKFCQIHQKYFAIVDSYTLKFYII